MNGFKNKFLAVALTILSIVGYGVIAFSYGQLTDGTAPDATNGYNVHEFILDPGCAPASTGCFKNTSYWELASNNQDIYFTSANVGVGIDTPTYKFHISGDMGVEYVGSASNTLQVIGDLSAILGTLDEGILSAVSDSSNPAVYGSSRIDYASGDPLIALVTRYSDSSSTNFNLKKTSGVPEVELKTTLTSAETSTFSMTGNTSGEPQTTLLNTYVMGGSGSFNILPVNNEPRIAMQSLLSTSASSYLTLAGDTSGEPDVKLHANFINGNYGRFTIENDNGEPNLGMVVVDSVNDSNAGLLIENNIGDGSDDFNLYSEMPGFFGNAQNSVASILTDSLNGEKKLNLHITNSAGRTAGFAANTNTSGFPELSFFVDSVTGVLGYFKISDDGSGNPVPLLQTVNSSAQPEQISYGFSAFSDNATYYRCNTNYPSVAGSVDCLDDRVIKIADDYIQTEFWNSVTTDNDDVVSTGQLIDDTGILFTFENPGVGSTGTGVDSNLKIDANLTFFNGTLDVFEVENDGGIFARALASGTGGGTYDAVCINSGTSEITINTGGDDCVVSSARFKKNIKDLDLGLDFINELRPRKFHYKENGEARIGFIAEEVKKLDDRLVFYEENGKTVRGVRYQDITAALTKAIQELDIKIGDIEPMDMENDTFVESLRNWFSDRANQLASIFVKKAYVEELCIGTEGDETCLTKDQIDQLLLQNNDDTTDNNNNNNNEDDLSDTTDDDTNDSSEDDTTDTADNDSSDDTPVDAENTSSTEDENTETDAGDSDSSVEVSSDEADSSSNSSDDGDTEPSSDPELGV